MFLSFSIENFVTVGIMLALMILLLHGAGQAVQWGQLKWQGA